MRRRALLMGGKSKPFQKYLIGYYPLDADFEDKIEPKVDLTGTGGLITLENGRVGNSAWCPPSTNATLRNTNINNADRHKFSLTDGTNDVPYSFSCHVYAISSGTSQGGTIWAKGVDNSSKTSTNSEYRISYSNDFTQITFTKFSEGMSANFIRYSVIAPPINTWYHLVITDDALGNVKIYINGVEQFKITTTGGTGYLKSSITPDSYVGMFNAIGVPSPGRFLEGSIDDFGMFKNYVLTQEDIDWIWNGGNPRRLKNV